MSSRYGPPQTGSVTPDPNQEPTSLPPVASAGSARQIAQALGLSQRYVNGLVADIRQAQGLPPVPTVPLLHRSSAMECEPPRPGESEQQRTARLENAWVEDIVEAYLSGDEERKEDAMQEVYNRIRRWGPKDGRIVRLIAACEADPALKKLLEFINMAIASLAERKDLPPTRWRDALQDAASEGAPGGKRSCEPLRLSGTVNDIWSFSVSDMLDYVIDAAGSHESSTSDGNHSSQGKSPAGAAPSSRRERSRRDPYGAIGPEPMEALELPGHRLSRRR